MSAKPVKHSKSKLLVGFSQTSLSMNYKPDSFKAKCVYMHANGMSHLLIIAHDSLECNCFLGDEIIK